MQKAPLAVVLLLLASPAAADPYRTAQLPKSANPGRTLPLRGAPPGNSCAAYGPGFVKIDGSDTCVQIGGAVSIGIGGSHR
jgi:hypothetical protein